MSSYLSDLDHHRINAQVFPGWVIETYHVSDSTNGQRKEPKTKVWRVEKVLGKGSSAEVRLETNQDDHEKRAVKRIWTSGTTLRKEYKRELMALLEFSKPKYKEAAVFVEFKGWFEDHDCVYLTMEYMPLGDLEHNVPEKSRITEGEVRDITSQILEGLRIMHLEKFVHRDLKPKNVLVCRGPPRWWVKLTDFGLSKKRTEDTEYTTYTGTQPYMAPEVHHYVPRIDPTGTEYTNAIDLWALGCIIYRLASGVVPFPPGHSLPNFCLDRSGFPFDFLALGNLGLEFLRGVLEPLPAQRWTAQEALNHPWMRIDLDFSYLNSRNSLERLNQLASDTASINFGQYRTETHPGLRSYESAATTARPTPATRPPEPKKPGTGSSLLESHRYHEIELPVGPLEMSATIMNKPKFTAGPFQNLLPVDVNARKAFSEGVTKDQLADLGLFLDIPAWEGGGPEEQRRWGGVWVDALRPATSSPNLQTQAQNAAMRGPMNANRGIYLTPGAHTRNLSAPKATTDRTTAPMSFASRVSSKQGTSLAHPSKSTKRSAKKKNSQQLHRNQVAQMAKVDYDDPIVIPDVLTPPIEYGNSAEEKPEEAAVKIGQAEPLQNRDFSQVPVQSYHITDKPVVSDPMFHHTLVKITPPKDHRTDDGGSDHKNRVLDPPPFPATQERLPHSAERTISQSPIPKNWSSNIPKIEQDVTSAFKAFALEQRRMVERNQAKRSSQAKSSLLADFVRFSSSFTLSTPIPKDLVPILAKDPARQEELQEKLKVAQKESQEQGKTRHPEIAKATKISTVEVAKS